MNILMQILQFVMSTIEIGAAFAFYYWLTGTRPDRKWKWVVLWIGIAVISLLFLSNRQGFYLSNLIIITNAIFVWLILCLLERKNYLHCLGSVFAFSSYIGLLQVFYGNLIMLFLPDKEKCFEQFYFGSGNWWRIFAYTVSLITVAVMFLIIRREKNIIRLWKAKWTMLIYGIIVWEISSWAQSQLFSGDKDGKVWALVILFILTLISFWGFSMAVSYYMTKMEMQMTEEKSKMWRTNYNEMQRIYENSLYTHHDFKNHMVVLQKYVMAGDMNSAREYLEKVIEPMDELNQYIWCQNEIVNLIINTKIMEAKKRNISVQLDVQDIDLQIAEYDMCCILSNLLDNAIEACEKIKTGTRWIHIRIWKKNASTIIKIANSIGDQPEKIAGEYVSHKAGGHGYGIKSVKCAVEKNGGTMNCENDMEKFVVTINFFK